MAREEPSELVVEFESMGRVGTSLKNLESWSIAGAFNTPSDAFEFVAYDHFHPERLFGLELEPVTLKLGTTTQLIGRIDRTTIGDSPAVTCEGRDFLADLAECSIDPLVVVREGDLIEDVVLSTSGPVGITVVFEEEEAQIIARAGFLPPGWQPGKTKKGKKQGDLKPEPGQSIFDFNNKLCARNSCTIQAGPERGSLVLVSPNYTQEPIGELTCGRAGGGNVESATAAHDFSSFPTYAMAYGHQAKLGESSEKAAARYDIFSFAASFAKQGSDALVSVLTDKILAGRRKPNESSEPVGFGQLYRLLTIRDEVARDGAQVDNAVLRAISSRLKESLTYTAKVRGHRAANGAVWSVNTLVSVKDEIRNVNEILWVLGRRLSYDHGAGATAELTCIRPGSYIIGSDA